MRGALATRCASLLLLYLRTARLRPPCGGDYSGNVVAVWALVEPSIALIGDGTLAIAVEGKSHRNSAHATPTFVTLCGAQTSTSFARSATTNETGSTVYGGATLLYLLKSTSFASLHRRYEQRLSARPWC